MAGEKDRGVLLTLWLILMLIFNTGTALMYLFLGQAIISAFPKAIPFWIVYIFIILSFANLLFTIFLFMWKKWAFFAFCASAIIIFLINISIGLGIFTSILGLTGVIILYLILRPKWNLLA